MCIMKEKRSLCQVEQLPCACLLDCHRQTHIRSATGPPIRHRANGAVGALCNSPNCVVAAKLEDSEQGWWRGRQGCWSPEGPDTSDSGWAALWQTKELLSYSWISTSRLGYPRWSRLPAGKVKLESTGLRDGGFLRGGWAADCNRSRWVPGAEYAR